MKCKYCQKEIKNPGSLAAHQKCCELNPNKIIFKRSPLAGRRKGCIPWNKGLKNPSEILQNSINLVESKNYLKQSEASIRRHVKKYLIYKHGNVCNICQNKNWNNLPIPLICDHIDGDHYNNSIENFRLICPNCDAQLPTFKSKNRGKGRRYDRIYRKNLLEGVRLDEELVLKTSSSSDTIGGSSPSPSASNLSPV